MKILEVTQVTENPDGSADVLLDVTPEGVKILFQYGFTAIMHEAIELARKEKNVKKSLKKVLRQQA